MATPTQALIASGMQSPLFFNKAASTAPLANTWMNLGSISGTPAAVAFGSPAAAGATVSAGDAIGGMFPWSDPAASTSAYLAQLKFSVGAGIIGLMVYDLLWYSGVVNASPFTINSVTWPARDADGATTGKGVQIWALNSVGASAGGSTTPISSYTNTTPTASRTGTALYVESNNTTLRTGAMIPIGMAGGDVGTASIQTIQALSHGLCTYVIIAIRPIATIHLPSDVVAGTYDWQQLGLPKLYAGSALYLACLCSGTAAGIVNGSIRLTQI